MSSTPPKRAPDAQTPAGAAQLPPLNGEAALLARIQEALLTVPVAVPVATALSHIGEHAIGWVALSVGGALLQPKQRHEWIITGTAAFTAHAASVVLKRVVRRTRPQHPTIAVGVATPSHLSFPSSHATSTTAFAVLAGRAIDIPGAPVVVPATLVPIMAASRLVLGVHYPSDVAGGVVLGAASAALAQATMPRLLETIAARARHRQAAKDA